MRTTVNILFLVPVDFFVQNSQPKTDSVFFLKFGKWKNNFILNKKQFLTKFILILGDPMNPKTPKDISRSFFFSKTHHFFIQVQTRKNVQEWMEIILIFL